MKDPERLKRQQKKREDAEKTALTQGQGEGGLKVNKWEEIKEMEINRKKCLLSLFLFYSDSRIYALYTGTAQTSISLLARLAFLLL